MDAVTGALIERDLTLSLADVAEDDSVANYRKRYPGGPLDLEESRLPIGPRIRPATDAMLEVLLRTLNRLDAP